MSEITMKLYLALRKKCEEKTFDPNLDGPALRSAFEKLGREALQEGNLYFAFFAFMNLHDIPGLQKVAQQAFQQGDYCIAYLVSNELKDKKGYLRIIQSNPDFRDCSLNNFLGSELCERVDQHFLAWANERGIDGAYNPSFTANAVHMASHLSGNYDLGIGIARGGLVSAYIFSLFGLPIKLANSHRRGKGATFAWIDDIQHEDLEGKNVAIFDKDVVTGRTTGRVLRELRQYEPKSIDLVLNLNPSGKYVIGTAVENIPVGYDAVRFPKDFSYEHFDKAVRLLEQKLGKERGEL